MSLCDTCAAPGHCCRALALNDGQTDMATAEQAQRWLDGVNRRNARAGVDPVEHRHLPMPFRPLFKRATEGGWMWWCPNLNRATGKCDDYANRPYTCRAYQPASDGLCVHYQPKAAS